MDNGIDPKVTNLLSFAWEMHHYVAGTSPWTVWKDSSLAFRGTVPISGVDVPCFYKIHSPWQEVPPSVLCGEKWVQREADWHAYGTGELCWVHVRLWKDVIQGLQPFLSGSDLIKTAAYWCIEHSSSLIAKHLEADRISYVGPWPEEWDDWAHYAEGNAEYEKAKRRGKVDRIIQDLLATVAKRMT
jgi:hypothetical protein